MSELSSEKIFGIVFIALFSVFTSCVEVNLFNKNVSKQSIDAAGEEREVVRTKGDLILGGLFTLHKRKPNDECSHLLSNPKNIMRVEAMLHAIDEVAQTVLIFQEYQ